MRPRQVDLPGKTGGTGAIIEDVSELPGFILNKFPGDASEPSLTLKSSVAGDDTAVEDFSKSSERRRRRSEFFFDQREAGASNLVFNGIGNEIRPRLVRNSSN